MKIMNVIKEVSYKGHTITMFEDGFGSNHMWVSEKESGKRLILVEF